MAQHFPHGGTAKLFAAVIGVWDVCEFGGDQGVAGACGPFGQMPATTRRQRGGSYNRTVVRHSTLERRHVGTAKAAVSVSGAGLVAVACRGNRSSSNNQLELHHHK